MRSAPVPTIAPVLVLPHIKRLDDCFATFSYAWSAGVALCREIRAPDRLEYDTQELALRMCSRCDRKAAERWRLRGAGRVRCFRSSMASSATRYALSRACLSGRDGRLETYPPPS